MALIAVEGMQFYAHHGYHKEEQVLGGKYVVDIYFRLDISEAAATDQLSKTIDYEAIYRVTKQEMEKRSNLIEHVCRRILEALQGAYPGISYLRVRVSKHNPPLKGHVERVFVELES